MASPNPPRSSPRRVAQALRWPVLGLAVILVLFDDLFRAWVRPAFAYLARLQPIRRIEAWIGMLPPYPTLSLFLVPLAIVEALKLLALFWIGSGHVAYGMLTFVAAKVVGIGLAERLFSISRDKLLSIAWFGWCYRLVMAVKDRVHGWLAATRLWQALTGALRRVRDGMARLRRQVAARAAALWDWARRLWRSGGRGRLAAAQRYLRGRGGASR